MTLPLGGPPAVAGVAVAQSAAALGPCDICGSMAVVERRCKVICLNCRTILQSCADL